MENVKDRNELVSSLSLEGQKILVECAKTIIRNRQSAHESESSCPQEITLGKQFE